MTVDKKTRKGESMPEAPAFTIRNALRVDSFNLRKQIEVALKDIVFDLEIREFNIIPRVKPEEPKEEDK